MYRIFIKWARAKWYRSNQHGDPEYLKLHISISVHVYQVILNIKKTRFED